MRYLAALALALISSFASAAEYYWVVAGSESWTSSSATGACKNRIRSRGQESDYTFKSVSISDGVGSCSVTYNGDGKTYDYGEVLLRGDSCPSGQALSSSSGACEAPTNKCDAVKGATTTYTVKSQSGGNPPSSVVVSGCEASFSGVMACGNNTKGLYVCTGKLTFSGNEGTSTPNVTAFDCSNVDCSKEKVQPTASNSPCNYSTSGHTSTCTSKASSSTPGTTTGNQGADGKYTFTENPQATSTDTTVTTTVVTTANSGGGSTSVKTDEASVTKCVGASGNCTTKTGTTTSSTSTGSDGVVKDGGSSCVGETCEGEDGGTAGTFQGIEACGDECKWEVAGQRASTRLQEFGPTDADGKPIAIGNYVSQTYDRFKETPIIAAINGISLGDGGGSCPIVRAEVFGTSIGFDAICTLMPSIKEMIAPVMFAFWSLVAVFVFLSA